MRKEREIINLFMNNILVVEIIFLRGKNQRNDSKYISVALVPVGVEG